jgi:superfamily II DNA helicase RecQ
LTKYLPYDIPILATTATATVSVANDIKKQIG